MELYGKEASQFETVLQFFVEFLGHYPASEVEPALKRYVSLRTRFPSPADIIGILDCRIKRDSTYYKELLKRRGSLTNDEKDYLQGYEQQTLEDFE